MKLLKFKEIKNLLVETAKRWMAADPFRESAVISYYTIFAIPGLMIIIIWAAGLFFGEEAVRGEISNQISEMIGSGTAESVEQISKEASVEGDSHWFMKIIGILALVFGATTLFFQLQKSLNYLWDVEADPDNNFTKLLLDRASSLGLILVIAFLLLISLVISSIITVASGFISEYFGDEVAVLVKVLDFVLSIAIISLLFGVMYKVLPDVEIQWKSVWVGAIVTAVLFTLGKELLGLYFRFADPTSSFGAAGTIILLILWVNYSCLILFFGAEFTQVYAKKFGHPLQPSSHAKWRAGFSDKPKIAPAKNQS
ncbi:MAG: YihY/virulence factor BrkB family protein [Anditalea sp.]